MAIFQYDDFPPEEADDILENQKLMSRAQKKMCKEISFLIWIQPPKKVEKSNG
jgi:hypothetical protein